MRKTTLHIFNFYFSIFMIVWALPLKAQLSPGKLTKAHSKLEGINNCTQCHDIGNKISEQKCLNCHKELKSRITINKGYHVSSAIKGKQCITCHSEHHGLNFDMIRFDEKNFNHTLTGYELKGAHKTEIKDCKACHMPDNISNAILKVKQGTFLGLEGKCLSCHEDKHQGTLSNDCTSCHSMTDFKPANLFNHNKTSFPLAGAHQSVNCVDCHKIENKNGKPFQKFADIAHKNCASCHKDVHHNEFGNQCKSCHNETSFHKISPSKFFNHQITGYALEGKHRELDCKKCHDNRNQITKAFSEFKKIESIQCNTCHQDIHDGKFGEDCKSCHNQNSWKLNTDNEKVMAAFDHDKTNFSLEGKHEAVDCKKCHIGELTDAVSHNTCNACHKDYHHSEFDGIKDRYPDCASCHTTQGFSPSLYTLEWHNQSTFVLTGAHEATACYNCHFKNNQWTFSGLGQQCIDCHNDIHDGLIDRKYYGAAACQTCHITDNWHTVQFEHGQTAFDLEGKHSTVACSACHIERTGSILKQSFGGKSKDCAACHENIHGAQFEIEGRTDCGRCHGFESWDQSNFNHNNTKFPLEGGHISVQCVKCHKEVTEYNGKQVVNYRIKQFECIDCHQ